LQKDGARGNINRKAVFTPPAFHPKALRFKICIWQVFWLVSCLLPSHPSVEGQWPQCKRFYRTNETHSYGDSAGITPDFPFNPDTRGPDRTKL